MLRTSWLMNVRKFVRQWRHWFLCFWKVS